MSGYLKHFQSYVLISSIFSFILLSIPHTGHCAKPGVKLFNTGLGVMTRSFSEGTALEHWVEVIDHDGVAGDGSSHSVRVVYPDGSTTRDLYFNYSTGPNSAIYNYWDDTVPTPIPASFTGTYTYRVEEVGNPSNYSEATDYLYVSPTGVPDESTFSPNFSSPQSITAYFDNVTVNGVLYDDLNSGFDDTNWNYPADYVLFENGQVKFNLSFNPGRGSYYYSLIDPSSVKQLKATVKVDSMTGDKARARIHGIFCSDNLGDVYTSVRINGSEAFYTISVERMEGDHFREIYYMRDTSMGPVTMGNRYDLSMELNEATSTYTFRVVGLDDSINYEATYTLSGPIHLPIEPSSGISVACWVETTTTPTFNWATLPNANHYCIRIYGLNNNIIYVGYATEPPYTLPPGILKPDSIYKYRLYALNHHQWFEWDNSGSSDENKTRFITGPLETQSPSVELHSIGVQTWNERDPYGPHTSVYVKVNDAQGVPDNIQSVTAKHVSSGKTVNLYLSSNDSPNRGTYQGIFFEYPQGGNYEITANDKDGNSHAVIENLDVNPINIIEEGSLQPTEGTLLNGTSPTFQWQDNSDAAFYELELYDKNFNYLFTIRTTDNSYTLPEGILTEGSLFHWQVLGRKDFFEDNDDNGTNAPSNVSAMITFQTTAVSGSNPPSIDLANWGVAVWNGPNPMTGLPDYHLEFGVNVTDNDGVPKNIKKVEVTYPDGTKQLLKYMNWAETGINYFRSEALSDLSSAQTGWYTFTAEDFEGNTATVSDELLDVLTNALPWVSNVAPIDGTIVDSTTPTITWNPIPGGKAKYYTVRFVNAWTTPTVYWGNPITQTIYTPPPNVLTPNNTYGYRIYAYGNDIGTEVDYWSCSANWQARNFHISIPDTPVGTDSCQPHRPQFWYSSCNDNL